MDYSNMFDVTFFQTALDSVVVSVGNVFSLSMFMKIMPLILIITFVVIVVFGLMSFAFGIFNLSWSSFISDDNLDSFIKDKETKRKNKERFEAFYSSKRNK